MAAINPSTIGNRSTKTISFASRLKKFRITEVRPN
jgi:hypothetical protein